MAGNSYKTHHDFGQMLPDCELSDLDLEESEDESSPLFEPAEEEHDGRYEDSDDEYDLPLILQDETEADLIPNSSADQRRIWKNATVHEKDVSWKEHIPSPDSSLVTPIAFFQKFFDSVMISSLVEETNRYVLQQTIASQK
ncbi:hypothetical protein QYM36_012616 [Artemia franciscana]|uniref:PiggyBac transposable element-derived protein domain-containing protein n=1 Tax=Artemia franciscana TaxID=6661 RepID=A0AA88HT74_ARTSF|nr:hypothetical protein QYM36_012616 [Artemia franciscana]